MIEFISQLPTEYQEVEYIESSGTQHIDTGFMPNQDTRVVCDIDYTLTAATAWLFGARTSNEVKTYNVLTYSSKYRSDYNNKTLDCTSHVNPTGRFVLDKNKNITYFDNVVGVDMTYAAFQCDYTLYLFANNEAGTAAKHGTFKLFSCCVYDNGTLVRDFVPCYRKADNVAGLYDLVNNVFYTNSGSGVFAVGADSNKHATATITPGGVIPMQYALRRRMMVAGGGALISKLPLGTLINIGTDGGADTSNYEIADKNNLVSGGVVLVRKNIYSNSAFGSTTTYPNGTLDNLIKTTIYNEMPQKLRNKMMNVSFKLYGYGDITRKMFALTYTMAGFGNNNRFAEGKALQLYTSNASRKKTFNGSASGWWLSSRYTSGNAWGVYAAGSASSNNPSYSNGVVPAFAIPSKTPYDLTPNTDGSYNLIL